MSILEVSGLKKIYKTRFGGNQVEALRSVSFSVEKGEYVAMKELRKHIAWYYKGLPNAARMRDLINTVSTMEELQNLLQMKF